MDCLRPPESSPLMLQFGSTDQSQCRHTRIECVHKSPQCLEGEPTSSFADRLLEFEGGPLEDEQHLERRRHGIFHEPKPRSHHLLLDGKKTLRREKRFQKPSVVPHPTKKGTP